MWHLNYQTSEVTRRQRMVCGQNKSELHMFPSINWLVLVVTVAYLVVFNSKSLRSKLIVLVYTFGHVFPFHEGLQAYR